MSEHKKDELTAHDYDGIREYNNPLPNWWLIAFIGTIIFAGAYYYHYTFGGGPSLKEELASAMTVIEEHKSHDHPAEIGDAELESQIKAADLKMAGESFKAKCAACHGNDLQGVIGPNLTDEFWIHGKGTPKDIVTVISNGVPDKGMPTWSAILKREEIVSLAAFIISKQDSHPANPKAPQGEKVR